MDAYDLQDSPSRSSAGLSSVDLDSPPVRGRRDEPAASMDRSPRSLAGPPDHQERWLSWVLLSLVLLIAAAPMTMLLQAADVTDPREADALATSIATWRRMTASAGTQAFSMDLLVPTYNNVPQLEHPPGVVWMHLIAFGRATGAPVAVDTMVFRARISAAVFGLLTVAAMFWAGHSIGTQRTAAFAGLVCAATPLFVFEARLASPAIYHIGWSMLSIAAALWAVRPLRPPPAIERQFIGWVICGLALGAALLTSGLAAATAVLLPLLLILLLCPDRPGHLMGLMAAALIAVLMTMPWAVLAHQLDPDLWRSWLAGLQIFDGEAYKLGLANAGDRLLLLVGLASLPWTLWLAAAVFQPFSTSSAGRRTRMFIGWAWLATAIAALIVTPYTQTSDALAPLAPVIAIVVAQLFRQYHDLSQQSRTTRFWRLIRWPHVAVLLLASIALPWGVYCQQGLVDRGWLAEPIFASVSMTPVIGAMIVLLLIVGLSVRRMLRHDPGQTLVLWTMWVIAATAFLQWPLSQGPTMTSTIRPAAENVGRIAGSDPVYWLVDGKAATLASDFVVYADRSIPALRPTQVAELLDRDERFYLLAPTDARPPVSDLWTPLRMLPDAHVQLLYYDGPEARSAANPMKRPGVVEVSESLESVAEPAEAVLELEAEVSTETQAEAEALDEGAESPANPPESSDETPATSTMPTSDVVEATEVPNVTDMPDPSEAVDVEKPAELPTTDSRDMIESDAP